MNLVNDEHLIDAGVAVHREKHNTIASSLAIIMPAYNESGNIQRAVGAVSAVMPDANIVVISDGSTDATAELARQAGAIVIELPFNLGIGGAVQTGYKFAVERGHRFVARLDGDGQHDPRHLARLMEPVLFGHADIVIGSRFIGETDTTRDDVYRATLLRSIGIRLFARLVSIIVRQRVTDTTSGYQVCNADAAAFFARNFPCDYPEVEMITEACRAGYRVMEIPVQMHRRLAGRSSITSMRSIYYVVKVLLVLMVCVMRRPEGRVVARSMPMLDTQRPPARADHRFA
jgi:glycosyltransferase involved in cell wall biosynthesis